MTNWKTHVRGRLFLRDALQNDPYTGVFNRLSQLAERLEVREVLDGVNSSLGKWEVGNRLHLLQLREGEHLAEKSHLTDGSFSKNIDRRNSAQNELSQTVSDLTSVLYLKDAEVQYWQSQVSRYRQEALTLAKGSNALKATLSECEFTIESQSKELVALRIEQKELREGLAESWREKEELLQRWMDEKRAEAERVNKCNDAQERWQRLARRLNRHLQREIGKQNSGHTVTNSLSGTTETPSPDQRKYQQSIVNK